MRSTYYLNLIYRVSHETYYLNLIYRVSQETSQLVNNYESRLSYTVLDIKGFWQFILIKKLFFDIICLYLNLYNKARKDFY